MVIVPKYRKKRLYSKFSNAVGHLVTELCRQKRVTGLHFWSRGYDVSTIGLAEETIRKYIRDQEKLEKRQLNLDLD